MTKEKVLVAVMVLGSLACTAKIVTKGQRESGQSRLMDDTFAGKNACNPENHLRPFIIEWDGTDRSSFESHATTDLILVHYEGCSLRVLDECRNDSIRGEQGSYLPVEWTSGALEVIDIRSEGELYAKLPLGSASLGGRVSSGEKFHMEYYVAGTRNATRDAVYRAELTDNPGCEDATHFVYAYNLGAFALGSASGLNVEAGASAYGFQAGGKGVESASAEKQGGKLSVCESESATEVLGCKAPIRLTLRKVRDGENPNKVALKAEDTDASLNAAGQVSERLDMSEEARAYYESANAKANARDGKGCLAELDAHDRLDPKRKSTEPHSIFSYMRSQCLMLAGKCKAGKDLARKYLEKQTNVLSPEQIDSSVESFVKMYCEGELTDREKLLKALYNLQQGAYMTRKTVEFCDQQYKAARTLLAKVEPRDEDDHEVINAESAMVGSVPACYARAGDCARAYQTFRTLLPSRQSIDDIQDEQMRKDTWNRLFESNVQKCKGKAAP